MLDASFRIYSDMPHKSDDKSRRCIELLATRASGRLVIEVCKVCRREGTLGDGEFLGLRIAIDKDINFCSLQGTATQDRNFNPAPEVVGTPICGIIALVLCM
jgi:hypothetical protein